MSLSLDQIYQTVWVPYAGNGPVFPPVLERLPFCRGRWPNRSVFRPAQQTGCVNTCVPPASPHAPLPDPAGGEMEALFYRFVSESASPGHPGEKKKYHPFIQQLNWKSPNCRFLSSPCWSGRGCWNLWMTGILRWWMTLQIRVSAQSVKGCTAALWERVVTFHWLLTATPTKAASPGVLISTHGPCLKIFAHTPWQARKQGANLVASQFN